MKSAIVVVLFIVFASDVVGDEQQANKPTGKTRPMANESVASDTQSLASLIRPEIPKGWTLSVKENQVVIERTEPVEVYNGIALPFFATEAELLRYVRPSVRRERFIISLAFGNQMTKDEVMRANERNSQALETARRDRRDGKFMPDEAYWREHPEYAYQKIPSFYASTQSIYMTVTVQPRPAEGPRGAVIRFWDESIEAECRQVLDNLSRHFDAY
jgi:hypothetical protein